MKICFLILVHNDPDVLRRLVYALDYPGFDFVIHVDAKSDIDIYSFDKYELKYSNIVVLSNRHRVFWGDISIVEATIDMYKKAIEMGEYDRYITLSGNDYPIMSNSEIKRLLENEEREYIIGNPIFENDFHKIERYYFFKYSRLIRLGIRLMVNLILPKKKKYVFINDKKCDIYFAPQWHALTNSCVKYILKTIESNPQIMKYFKYSFAPDELLIPTIIFNSNFDTFQPDEKITIKTHYNQKNATHYLNYDGPIEIFDEKKYDEIINSSKLFVRKVRTGKSDKLIDMLENRKKEISDHAK